MAGGALFGGELLGDLMGRAVIKFGGSKLLNAVKIPADMQPGVLRVAIGLFGAPVLKMVGIPETIRKGFSAINVASGLIGLTYGIRQKAFTAAGLSDYELADAMSDDDGSDDAVGDYELADGEDNYLLGDGTNSPPAGLLSSDFSDQDYYGSYDTP